MRTIKITHEQYEMMVQATKIAEKQFNELFEDIMKKTIRTNTGYSLSEQTEAAKYYFNKSNEFYDLGEILKNGEADV